MGDGGGGGDYGKQFDQIGKMLPTTVVVLSRVHKNKTAKLR